MSPSENNPAETVDFMSEVNSALVGGDISSANSTPELAAASDSSTPTLSSRTNRPKKKLSKSKKVALFTTGWILLLGVAAAVALLLKPAPEIVYTDAIIEAYKFSGPNSAEILDTVDDLDYYSYYTVNPLTLNRVEAAPYGMVNYYTISGLKNKPVEDKINNRIKAVFEQLNADFSSNRGGYVQTTVVANYFNVISFKFNRYDYGTSRQEGTGHTFELVNGDELTFDDLFSANLNLTSLLFKSFYDTLSANIQFSKLSAKQRLSSAEAFASDPSKCMMYCPKPGETADSLRTLIADYDAQMTNIEQITTNAIQNYLTGEKKFYLNSFGPVFILSDGTEVEMELKDNIRYAVYLKNYRTAGSIFEGGTENPSNPFFTELPNSYQNYRNEEADTYLFDYTEGLSSNGDISPEIHQALRDYLRNKGLSVPGEEGKFRRISADGNVTVWNQVRAGYFTICVYETDKPYYDSVYRKVIIDEKTQRDWLAPSKAGRYDQDRVTQLPVDGNTNSCYQQKHVAITNSGAILENVDDILISPQGLESWQDRFKREAYNFVCNRSWDPQCYTEEEKRSHELFYVFSGSDVTIRLKDDSEQGYRHLYTINLNAIPRQYINPAILVE